jgi:4-amino-4-deoxy-L-arabinose transferase-like glycosyltransferase
LSRPSILRADWFLLACVCAFFFFFGLSYFGLIGADEPRYAQIAREMLARHDWITPTLGGQPWLEKPVLYYWEAMLSYSIFGVSDWAARVPSAVDATLLVLAVYFFLRKLAKGAELDGALMTASAAGVVGFARAASTDMPLAATFGIAMLAWYAWYGEGAQKYLAVFYVFLGLGTLAKGPVAPFLAAVIIVLFVAAKREWILVVRTLWLPGIVLFCAVALPWYVAVQLRNPQFFREFILQHNLARFSSNLYHHQQPFWYYIPVLLLGLIPWAVFVLSALLSSLRGWWKNRVELNEETSLDLFLMLWLIFPVVFFSLSQSKLPGYIIPAIPAGTVLLARYVRRHASDKPVVTVLLHAIVASGPIVPALMMQYLLLQHHLPWGPATMISIALALLIAVAMFFSLLRYGLVWLRFVTLIPAVLVVGIVLRIGAPALDAKLSARPVAGEIAHFDTKQLPLAVFRVNRDLQYGLAFYRNEVIARYEAGQIPAQEHFLVAPTGYQVEIAKLVPGRRVSYLGGFAPQNLDYFWVSSQP